MTEEDLVTALDGLLETGLVCVDVEEAFDEEAGVPRFRPTQRGRVILAVHQEVDRLVEVEQT
jgi:hypothetical protein